MNNDISIPKIGSENEEGLLQKKMRSISSKKPFSSSNKKSYHWKRWILISVLGVILGIVLIGISLYFPVKKIITNAQEVLVYGNKAKEAAKAQDLEGLQKELTITQEKLENLQRSYASLSWVKFIPFVGAYYQDGQHGILAAREFIQAGSIAVSELIPYQDLLGLGEGQSSFVDQPADKRIETAIVTFDKVIPKLNEISKHLDIGKNELLAINSDRYPETIQGKQIRSRIVDAQNLAQKTINLFVNAQPLIKNIPQLMGMNGEKRYLLLFQNDKELRPTGGFITAYALLTFNKGKMRVETSSNIYDLDERQKKNIKAPKEILMYHKGVYYAYLRDSNLSPDFKVSMKMFEDLLQNISNPPTYEGIFAVDTSVLVETIKILDGDIFIPEYGVHFTTDPDDRCDGCPNVIYELSDIVGRRVGHVRENRKDILGKLMFALMQKSLGVSPSKYWGRLTQMFLDQAEKKHILVYMKDESVQKALEAVNFAGRIVDYNGDYLHINDTNFAGAKSNLFVKHFVTQEINVAKDGSVSKTITIDYKNPSPPSDCNLENEGLCLNGLLRNWIRIYVPKGAELVRFEGSETEVITKEELGKTVFEGFLTVAPKSSSRVVVEYKLPFKVTDQYNILIQKQPGTEGHEYTIRLNGKTKESFKLTTDREFHYRI